MKIFYQYLSTKLRFVCILAGMLFIHAGVFGQGFAVSGTVTDASGPLPGVNVVIKGTMIGQVTDANGAFTITVPNADAVLVFTSIGYTAQELVVGNNRTMNVVMQEDTQTFEEVVVVGYGVQRKVTVTGAVSTMRGEELKSSPTTNLSNGIVGRMPGVIGFQRSDEPGGGGTTIRVRGTTTQGFKDPLYVIDGIPDREGGFNRLNPGDIESISVLKDASAAIYGSRAANGVVLITTRRGVEGKPLISYSGGVGFTQPTRLPKLCNSFEYATLVNEIDQYYKGQPGRYSADDLQKYKDGSSPWTHPNSNYMEAIKKVSPTYRHEIGVSGGTERVRYFTNLSFVGEEGIFKSYTDPDGKYWDPANRFDNYSLRTNLDVKINDYISLAYGLTGRLEQTNYAAFSAGDTFTSIVRSKPTDVGFWPNGYPGMDLEYGHQPMIMASRISGTDLQKRYYFQNDLRSTIKVPGIEGLTIVSSFSYDKMFYNRKFLRTPFLLYSWKGDDARTMIPATRGGGSGYVIDLERRHEDRTSWLVNTVVNYNFTIAGAHNFGLMVGMEGQSKFHEYMRTYRKNFLAPFPDEIDNGPLEERENNGNSWREKRLNYFGRAMYNFQEKYLFEIIGRYDGSWRFPKDKRYGFFPGVSAAWRVSEEDFWKSNVAGINFFKLRGSISQTGIDVLVDNDGNVERNFHYMSTYNFGTDYLLGSTFSRTLKPARIPNPEITWEKQTEYNIGIELRMLKNRLTLESDVYLRKRQNMLRNRNASVPRSAGMSLPRENIGEMSNRGIELLLRWDDRKGDLNYYFAYNMTYSKDRLDFIDEQPGLKPWQVETGMVTGTEMFFIVDGVFQSKAEIDAAPAKWGNAAPGDLIFRDVDGNGIIDGEDRVRLNKRKEPLFIAGFLAGVDWKGFDAKIFLQGATGGHTYVYRERAGESGNFFKFMFDERWTPENPSTKYPRIYNREEPYWASEGSARRNTHFLRKTDYLRLKNAEIGYSFHTLAFLKNLNIQTLRLYVQGSNLITIDKVKFQDPEQNNASKDYMQRRYYHVGATLTF